MSTAASRQRSDIGPVIVMGVSGAGKSLVGERVAEALGLPFIEGDGLHPRANVEKMAGGVPLTDEDRWPWLDRIGEELRTAVGEHGGAVAACSALRRVYRDRLRRGVGAALRFVFLEAGRETIAARMARRRHHFMPLALLDSQLATLESPVGEADVMRIGVAGRPALIAGEAVRWLARGDREGEAWKTV
jgi:gluconokinase